MAIIISSATVGAGKIGYKNLFTTSGVTVTASTEASTYAKENAYDGFGYDWWKPTATGDSWLRTSFGSSQTANYMAIWGHDLSDHGSSIKPQYSTDSGANWTDADSAVSPSDNDTLFFSWSDINAADWRVLVTNPTTIAQIAGVQIGVTLDLPKGMRPGFAPPSLVPIIETVTRRSESGVFISGRKMSEGIKGSIKLKNIDPAWIRSDWIPFIDHVQTPKTFVFAWDDVTHTGEVVHAWVSGKVSPPKYQDPTYMSLALKFEGTK